MLKAITFPEERAEEAMAAVRTLVDLSTEQLEICSQASEELELSGELKTDSMKRLVRIQSEIRKARATIKELATPRQEPPAEVDQ